MSHFFKKHWWGLVFGTALLGYSTFCVLDTFLIPKNVVSIDNYNEYPDSFTSSVSNDNNNNSGDNTGNIIVTDTSYTSDSVAINITTLREYNTDIYVADVVIKDISYLHAGLANGVFGRNITAKTSDIASDCDAILAINGDYYGFRDYGPVIRNGYLYRSSARDSSSEALAIYNDGNMKILKESDINTDSLLSDGVLQLFSFGPRLVENGNVAVSAGQEVDQSMTSNPRTAIGIIAPLHYVFVVSDGRTSASSGLSLLQLASVLRDLGCETAYNLDGGGSSTMYFMGNIINNPTTNGKTISEMKVSDIVYIR